MEQILETCELCKMEKTGTYTPFGIGVLGAAFSTMTKRIAPRVE